MTVFAISGRLAGDKVDGAKFTKVRDHFKRMKERPAVKVEDNRCYRRACAA